jgi:4-hydroxy-2-oxoheptanedioate aldolase
MIKFVRSTKYPPEGNRGSTDYCRAAKYGAWDWSSYRKDANKETLVIPLIEDKEGIDNIDEILSVKGIDVVRIGAFDISMELGFGGEYTSVVKEQVEKIISSCREKGIPTGAGAYDVDSAKKAIEKGHRMIVFDDETSIFRRLCQKFIDELKTYQN